MNARALAAWSGSGLCIALSTNNPVYRALVLLCAVNLVLARGTSPTRLRQVLVGVGIACNRLLPVGFGRTKPIAPARLADRLRS